MTTLSEKVATYIKLRDYKKAKSDEFKKSMERVELAMEKLEGELLSGLDDVGANSLASDVGTVYKKTEVSCSVEDPSAFRDFVEQNSNWAAVDLRANKTFVREMMEKEGSTPPGIKVTTMVNVGVRRS